MVKKSALIFSGLLLVLSISLFGQQAVVFHRGDAAGTKVQDVVMNWHELGSASSSSSEDWSWLETCNS